MNIPLKLQRTASLDDILDDIERNNIRIRYYRFYKEKEGYVFKTFIDRKDGHTHQFIGSGATRVAAVLEAIENIKNDRYTLSTYTRKSKKAKNESSV